MSAKKPNRTQPDELPPTREEIRAAYAERSLWSNALRQFADPANGFFEPLHAHEVAQFIERLKQGYADAVSRARDEALSNAAAAAAIAVAEATRNAQAAAAVAVAVTEATRAANARIAELEAEVERMRGLLRRGLDLNIVEANCSGVDDWEGDVTAALAPPTPPAQLHPATAELVLRFAAALREKLAAAEQKYGYRDNWRDSTWLDECRAQLAAHVAKGDPRDVAAYCAFLWHHGASTAALAPQAPKEVRP